MPRLPDINEIQRPQVRPSTNVVQNSAVGVVGNAMSKLGGDVEKMAQAELIKLHEAKAREAEIAMRTAEFELSAEAEQVRLGNVLPKDGEKPFAEQRMEKFDAKAAAIAEGLSPTQKEMFGQRLAEIRLNHNARVVKHAVIEGEKYENQTFEGKVALELQTAQKRSDEPATVEASVKATKELYDQRVSAGYDPSLVKAAKQKAVSDLHVAVLKEMSSKGNFMQARDYYAKHEGEILDTAVGGKIAQDSDEKQAMTLAGDLIGAVPLNSPINKEAMYKEVEKKLGPSASPAIIKMARQEIDTLTQVRRDKLNKAEAEPISMLLNGATLEQVKRTPEYRALDTEGRNRIDSFADTSDKAPDYAKIARVDALMSAPQTLAGMTRAEVILYAKKHNLGRSGAISLLAAHTEVQKPSGLREAEVDATELKQAFLLAGKKPPTEKDEDYVWAKTYMREAAAAEQLRLQRKLTPTERRAVYSTAMAEVLISKGKLWDTTKLRYQMTPEDIGAAQAVGSLPRE